MKAAKWRDMSSDELSQQVRNLTEELFNLRLQLAMGVAKNPARVGRIAGRQRGLAVGDRADFVLFRWDENAKRLTLAETIMSGQTVFSA